ncbi:hypothetical protein Pcinc_034524 [Petrolisthes cinctipes]|uniref:limulus clotting factor C n=1 Tax=Petrolisthes cinctipes TaxID=88211 RepID=A0AAE1JZ11_PETCI|nr:hypothetical protein Pcinc_034524 [Petrolisthes cinctipes]
MKEDWRQGGVMVTPRTLLVGEAFADHRANDCEMKKELVEEEVTIESPNFPKKYPNKACVRWELESADPEKTLQMECDTFVVKKSKKCRGDRLTMSEEGGSESTICGKKEPAFETKSNKFVAEFHSNGKKRAKGFKCTVRSVRASTGVTSTGEWNTDNPTTTKAPVTTKAPATTKAPVTTKPPTGTCKCGEANPTRIVGGTEVSPTHKFPWHIGLKKKNHGNYWCGGSIINNKFALTAAHCFFDNEGNRNSDVGLVVGVGDHDMYQTSDNLSGVTRLVDVEKVIIHGNYNPKGYDYDMALLQLKETLDFTKHKAVQSVCLPKSSTTTYGGETGFAYGWGRLTDGGNQPAKLMEVKLPILEPSCWGKQVTKRMLCAGYKEGGKDTCQGDSGGPLTVIESNKHTQVGVVSFGQGCANANSPGVYARITEFLEWIKKNTAGATYCD